MKLVDWQPAGALERPCRQSRVGRVFVGRETGFIQEPSSSETGLRSGTRSQLAIGPSASRDLCMSGPHCRTVHRSRMVVGRGSRVLQEWPGYALQVRKPGMNSLRQPELSLVLGNSLLLRMPEESKSSKGPNRLGLLGNKK
jgi:hypothetical protein